MSYTPPGMPLDVSWAGTSSYIVPVLPLDVSWQSEGVAAQIRITGRRGRVAVSGEVASHSAVTGAISARGPRGRVSLGMGVVVRGGALVGGPRARLAVRGSVIRYELRGEVREQGELVERRVRAYLRDTGALAGEMETIAGRFVIHVGFEPAEHYIIPLNLDESATDFAPPCANRVLSVLAQDLT